jgi:hypothetical protein
MRVLERGVEGEAARDEREKRLGQQQQATPVDGVCDCAAHDGQRQERGQLAEREQADLER